MGKRLYNQSLVDEILRFLEDHSFKETRQKYGVYPRTIYTWLNPSIHENQKMRCKDYMNKKLKDPLFKRQFMNKMYVKYQTDPEYRARRKMQTSVSMKKGRKTNPKYRETYIKNLRKRRALKLLVQENYGPDDEKYTRDLFNHKCAVCRCDDDLQIDHWYPLSKGFALSRTNAVLLCKACNLAKGDKLPTEHYDESVYRSIGSILTQTGNLGNPSSVSS